MVALAKSDWTVSKVISIESITQVRRLSLYVTCYIAWFIAGRTKWVILRWFFIIANAYNYIDLYSALLATVVHQKIVSKVESLIHVKLNTNTAIVIEIKTIVPNITALLINSNPLIANSNSFPFCNGINILNSVFIVW